MHIASKQIMDADEIAAGGSLDSEKINLNYPQGFFSLQAEISGSGTVKFEFLLSNNGVDYLAPEAGGVIVENLDSGSGPAADGKVFVEFSVPVAPHIMIKAAETGGASAAILPYGCGL